MNCSCVTLCVEFEICLTISEHVSSYLVISIVVQGKGRQICSWKAQKSFPVATLRSPVDTWNSSAMALQPRSSGLASTICPVHEVDAVGQMYCPLARSNVHAGGMCIADVAVGVAVGVPTNSE